MPVFHVQSSGAMPKILPEEKALFGVHSPGLAVAPAGPWHSAQEWPGDPEGALQRWGMNCERWRTLDANWKLAYALNLLYGNRLYSGGGAPQPYSSEDRRLGNNLVRAIDQHCFQFVPQSPTQDTRAQQLLARLGMTCTTWQAQSKDPAVRARHVQLSLGVTEGEAAEIRDALDSFCSSRGGRLVGILAPSGSVSDWWNSEPIVFTSKNYVVGGAIGLAAGALAMHLSMKMKKR